MMFTRVAPLRLKFSLMGSRTLVARTISSLTPFKALPTSVSLSPRLYTSAVSMKLIPLSRATFTIRVVSSWPRLPMFILPPNCMVPSANSLTIRPVFPSFLYFIRFAPPDTEVQTNPLHGHLPEGASLSPFVRDIQMGLLFHLQKHRREVLLLSLPRLYQ